VCFVLAAMAGLFNAKEMFRARRLSCCRRFAACSSTTVLAYLVTL
jgi:hypothetical protein